jgi:Cysteine-rich CWC
MNTPAQNICPRCHADFECRPDAIELCQCSKVTLSAEDRRYISERYSDCLCGKCLQEIKQIVENETPDKN